MSTTIYEGETITLLDGTEIKIRPLKISLLRPFMKKFGSLENVSEDNEKTVDLLLECVQIAMKQYSPELADDKKKLEDILDLPTVYKIVGMASSADFDA